MDVNTPPLLIRQDEALGSTAFNKPKTSLS
jgi:hypothetical protein